MTFHFKSDVSVSVCRIRIFVCVGKPMKLIYFVSPYDLLDKKTMSAHPMTVEGENLAY